MTVTDANGGESWDLASEYPAPDCAEIDDDLAKIDALLDALDRVAAVLRSQLEDAETLSVGNAETGIEAAREAFVLGEASERLLGDVETYAECRQSVDSSDEAAQALIGRLQAYLKRNAEIAEPLWEFLDRVPDDVAEAFLDDERTAPARFVVEHARKRRRERLSLEQETLVSSLAQDGIHAWGRLYDQLSGTLTCEVPDAGATRTVGLAEASGLLLTPDDGVRENAWRAINATWDQHVETCSAAINAIAGWRLEMCGRRGTHFLDAPLHMNRIERATLQTILGVAQEAMPLARRAARLQAKAYGKPRYGPWDQRAPAPSTGEHETAAIPYPEAIKIIATSYGSIDPRMGEFVRMMSSKHWIEGTVGKRKRPGAYCTHFRKSRTPRVYMTYTGGASDVITLAHELGHAFHAWVVRELPDCQRRYGMSIAETASTFGETIVRNALLERAGTQGAELDIVWQEADALIAFILNIPTRFEFERNFYEARAERPLRPDELKDMMSAAWRKWYGDSLAEPDPLFWANKLHFYISELSFYNFPYLFGYLFSLGLHARREAAGAEFFPRYEALLRDTGRTTAEELAHKYLDADLTQPAFWRGSIRMLESRIDHFETLVERVAV